MAKEICPVCQRPMTEFVDGWRCLNIKAPEHNPVTKSQRKKGGPGPGKGKKGGKK